MNIPFHPEDAEDFRGNPNAEAHLEMTLIFGSEQPHRAWILTDFDVWAKNPFYVGPDVPHPESDEEWAWLFIKPC